MCVLTGLYANCWTVEADGIYKGQYLLHHFLANAWLSNCSVTGVLISTLMVREAPNTLTPYTEIFHSVQVYLYLLLVNAEEWSDEDRALW